MVAVVYFIHLLLSYVFIFIYYLLLFIIIILLFISILWLFAIIYSFFLIKAPNILAHCHVNHCAFLLELYASVLP